MAWGVEDEATFDELVVLLRERVVAWIVKGRSAMV